jgi:hypothetical protein
MRLRSGALCVLSLLLVSCGSPPASSPAPPQTRSTRYEDLLTLFADWRAFQQPKRVNGVPDYSVAAHRRLRQGLGGADARGRHVRRPAAIARARLHSRRRAWRPRNWRPPDAQRRAHARASRRVRVRQHAARLAEPPGQPRPRRAVPLSPAARLRHELRDWQSRNGQADHGAQASAGRPVHDAAVHGRVQRGGPRADCVAAVGADWTVARRRQRDAESRKVAKSEGRKVSP